MKDRIKLDSVRYFDPITKPKTDPDLVIHIPVCLEDIKRREGAGDRDIACLKYNIQNFLTLTPSVNHLNIDFVICVNGFIYYDYIDYLEGLLPTKDFNFRIFQRPNVGWQWGAFYDVWLAYKHSNTKWFMSMEADVFLTKDYWFDYLKSFFKSEKVGHVGMVCPESVIGLDGGYGTVDKIPTRLWKKKTGETKQMTTQDTLHTRGGWYFCHWRLLNSMENAFGCFSHAMGKDQCMDGVLMGEVGFCQKATELGYKFFAADIQEIMK